MHAFTHTYLHTFVHTCLPICLHACLHMCLHTCLNMPTHTCLHTCRHTCRHKCPPGDTHAIHIYTQVYIHAQTLVYAHLACSTGRGCLPWGTRPCVDQMTCTPSSPSRPAPRHLDSVPAARPSRCRTASARSSRWPRATRQTGQACRTTASSCRTSLLDRLYRLYTNFTSKLH